MVTGTKHIAIINVFTHTTGYVTLYNLTTAVMGMGTLKNLGEQMPQSPTESFSFGKRLLGNPNNLIKKEFQSSR